jgi:hypothetical protein
MTCQGEQRKARLIFTDSASDLCIVPVDGCCTVPGLKQAVVQKKGHQFNRHPGVNSDSQDQLSPSSLSMLN